MPHKPKNLRVLGIDPGYDRMGIAIIEKNVGKERVVYSGCLTTDRKLLHSDRIFTLGKTVGETIKKYKPDVLAIEKIFFNENQKTAMSIAELRGVIMYEGSSRGLVIYQYTPLEIKTAVCGYGRADKKQVMSLIPKLIELPDKPGRLDDEFDAIAVALTCLARERFSYPHP
jgi:crossover junction endodeoxyribonuclease RuvC